MERELLFSFLSKALFAAMIAGMLLTFAYVIYQRFRLMTLGPAENRFDRIPDRIAAAVKFGIGQYRMPNEIVPGLLHIAIFGGFIVLGLRTIIIFGMGFAGSSFSLENLPVVGSIVGPLYGLLKDLVVLGVLIGCAGFAWRRLISKPVRMQNIHQAEPVLILSWISGLMFADMFLEAGYMAWLGHTHPSLGVLFTGLFDAESGETMWRAMVWVHSLMILIFLNYLPFGKHFHIITAIPNVFFAPLEPQGRLRPIAELEAKFEKMEQDPSIAIGISQFEHLHWKQVLDVYSCTECGRCVPNCPAWSTDKPLSHRDVNKAIKAHMYAKAPFLLAPKDTGVKPAGEGATPKVWEGEALTNGAVKAETIWSCTFCGDCEERCPVLIEQVPRIAQMRQHLAMVEGAIPAEVANYFKNVERNSNPWGLAPDKRADWIARAPEGVVIRQFCELSPEEAAKVEYLYFVGCMGSYDDGAQKIALALCKILNQAGVNFAVLGVEEQCNGECVRRLGNEYLGQMMAVMNIQTMMNYGVKKIIANCPHCFNTLKNEYSDFIAVARDTHDNKEAAAKYDGFKAFEVTHANEFVRKLVADGRIKMKSNPELGGVAYHDPCFLGRYNNVFDAQRELIGLAGGSVIEPSLTRRQSYCCGAGGGRMWMEEHEPRVNQHRFDEIMKSCNDPKLIGVSCPFCMTMLTDSSKDRGKEDHVKVRDVLQIVADNLAV